MLRPCWVNVTLTSSSRRIGSTERFTVLAAKPIDSVGAISATRSTWWQRA